MTTATIECKSETFDMDLIDKALENTREWDEWQALKEERKELQKKLDSVLDRTMSLWSQPELGL